MSEPEADFLEALAASVRELQGTARAAELARLHGLLGDPGRSGGGGPMSQSKDKPGDGMGNVKGGFGPTTLLRNGTFEGVELATVGGAPASAGYGWTTYYDLYSGGFTSSGVVSIYESLERSRPVTSATKFNSSTLWFGLGDADEGPFDLNLYLYPDTTSTFGAWQLKTPYLVGAVRAIYPSGAVFNANTTALLTLELVNTTTSSIVASSRTLDVKDLGPYDTIQLECYHEFTPANIGQSYRWRLSLRLTKSGSGFVLPFVYLAEPQFHAAFTKDPPLYTPQIGNWFPRRILGPSFVDGPDAMTIDVVYGGGAGIPTLVTRTDDAAVVSQSAISYSGANVANVVTTRFGRTITVTPLYTAADITSIDRTVTG